jgi:hypothetical protein
MKRQLIIGLSALASVGMLAACSSDDDNTVADVVDANSEVCQDLGAYADSLAALEALDPATATKADYEDAIGAVKSARSDLSDSAADLVEAEVENLQAQAEDLEGALADAPDDEAVADILAAVQVQVAEVRASSAAVNTAVCTPENSADTTEG